MRHASIKISTSSKQVMELKDPKLSGKEDVFTCIMCCSYSNKLPHFLLQTALQFGDQRYLQEFN